MSRERFVDLYSWESFKRIEGWKQLSTIFVQLFFLCGIVFGLLVVASVLGDTSVTVGMVLLFGLLSAGSAFLGTVMLWAVNHPNPWVARASHVVFLASIAVLLIVR